MRRRARLLAAAAAAGLTGGLAAPAPAFYFPGWPGAKVPPARTLIPPDTPPEGNPPSATPPLTDEEPVRPGTHPPHHGPNGPEPAPEPGTLTAALLGLAAVGTRLALRNRKKRAAKMCAA